jgi:hypothetical protein
VSVVARKLAGEKCDEARDECADIRTAYRVCGARLESVMAGEDVHGLSTVDHIASLLSTRALNGAWLDDATPAQMLVHELQSCVKTGGSPAALQQYKRPKGHAHTNRYSATLEGHPKVLTIGHDVTDG